MPDYPYPLATSNGAKKTSLLKIPCEFQGFAAPHEILVDGSMGTKWQRHIPKYSKKGVGFHDWIDQPMGLCFTALLDLCLGILQW